MTNDEPKIPVDVERIERLSFNMGKAGRYCFVQCDTCKTVFALNTPAPSELAVAMLGLQPAALQGIHPLDALRANGENVDCPACGSSYEPPPPPQPQQGSPA